MRKMIIMTLAVLMVMSLTYTAKAQSFLDIGSYGSKIYAVNSAFYPYVMVYFRTFDANREPLINITPFNVYLMVKGRAYDPYKKQYYLETLKKRREGFRTVILIDCSRSMTGQQFQDSLDAVRSYINLKTESDEIAIMALTDTVENICAFTKDRKKLWTLLNDLQPIGRETHLYDGLGQALLACKSAQGSTLSTESDAVILSNILVITDAIDEGSAYTRDNLLNEIMNMNPPIPIYAFINSPEDHIGIKDLASLCVRSFGKFQRVDSTSKLGMLCEKMQEINRHDYVMTFRSYIPVDGMKHNLKVVIDYEGRQLVDSAFFEAIEVPMVTEKLRRIRMALERQMPPVPDGNPYKGSDIPGVQKYGIQAPPPPPTPAAQ